VVVDHRWWWLVVAVDGDAGIGEGSSSGFCWWWLLGGRWCL
jgi:hypothetical protein